MISKKRFGKKLKLKSIQLYFPINILIFITETKIPILEKKVTDRHTNGLSCKSFSWSKQNFCY